MDQTDIKRVLEAALLAAGRPLTVDKLRELFAPKGDIERPALKEALEQLAADYEGRGIELKEVASGYRIQIRSSMSDWLGPLWEERTPRYTRALLETLALVAYRQPITRGEIEDVRGVAVSTNIMRTLLERGWVRVVGHRDVPGKPAMFGTTKEFLDYFGLKKLDDLPPLAELKDWAPEESPQTDLAFDPMQALVQAQAGLPEDLEAAEAAEAAGAAEANETNEADEAAGAAGAAEGPASGEDSDATPADAESGDGTELVADADGEPETEAASAVASETEQRADHEERSDEEQPSDTGPSAALEVQPDEEAIAEARSDDEPSVIEDEPSVIEEETTTSQATGTAEATAETGEAPAPSEDGEDGEDAIEEQWSAEIVRLPRSEPR